MYAMMIRDLTLIENSEKNINVEEKIIRAKAGSNKYYTTDSIVNEKKNSDEDGNKIILNNNDDMNQITEKYNEINDYSNFFVIKMI